MPRPGADVERPASHPPRHPPGRCTDAPGGPGLQFVAVLGYMALTTNSLEALNAVSAPTPSPPPAPAPGPLLPAGGRG